MMLKHNIGINAVHTGLQAPAHLTEHLGNNNIRRITCV